MKTLLIEVWKRLTPWNKSADVYSNDVDNAYPERMDRLINNSVTAKSAAAIMVQYLIGKGFGSENDSIVINKEKNLKLIDFADDVADDLVKQRGVFIHVNWNALYQISDFSVIPYEWCRIGKMDSNEYAGKVAVCKGWLKPKKSDIQLIDVFNPAKKLLTHRWKKQADGNTTKGRCCL